MLMVMVCVGRFCNADMRLCTGNRAAAGAGGFQCVAADGKLFQLLIYMAKRYPGVNERPEHHIAADAPAAVDIQAFHRI
jgi:hypothetical protein